MSIGHVAGEGIDQAVKDRQPAPRLLGGQVIELPAVPRRQRRLEPHQAAWFHRGGRRFEKIVVGGEPPFRLSVQSHPNREPAAVLPDDLNASNGFASRPMSDGVPWPRKRSSENHDATNARTDGRLGSIQLTLRQVSLFGPCRDIPHISGDRFCDPAGLAV